MEKKTPLYNQHLALGGKIINFGGWLLPVEYSSLATEHQAVREKAGLFDVSHMGEIEIQGPDALALVQELITNDAAKLEKNQALYGAMCYPEGGTVDDLVVYKMAEEKFFLVINGANIEKDYEWILEQKAGEVEISNISNSIAQIALQGPRSLSILKKLTAYPVEAIRYYWCQPDVMVAGVPCLVSRTGYTGEDGFEFYCPAQEAEKLWLALLEAGKDEGLVPAGLGARDTLRLEAGLPLYGQELTSEINPLEAGLGQRFVQLGKKGFIGQDALLEQENQGLRRKLVGIEMMDKGIPRHGYLLLKEGQEIGIITSGTQSPTLKRSIALALIQAPYAQIGQEIMVQVRNKQLRAKIVSRTFYRREVQ